MYLQPGKLNIGPIDATHGSSGKSKVSDYIASKEHLDFAISHNSQNASHISVFDEPVNGFMQYKFNFLPSAVARPGVKVVIGSDAVIDTKKALEEIHDWKLTTENLFIHPLVTIIEDKDVQWEMENLAHMGSTMTGGGAAKAHKILRIKEVFAKDHPELSKYVTNTHELVNGWLKEGKTGLLETAQGYDLSQDTIWTGLDGKVKHMYPYNTSRNINAASFMGFSFVPPKFAGNTILNIRSYPIRVGDASTVKGDIVVKMADGSEKGVYLEELKKQLGADAYLSHFSPDIDTIKKVYPDALGVVKLGSSGPVYDDQTELTWEEVQKRAGSPVSLEEKTSLTKRIRRVFDRSALQIRNSTMACQPNVISINFVNYIDHKITGVSGKMNLGDLKAQYPKVAEYVEWVEKTQYWAGTEYAGKVMLLGTGAKRSEIIELQ
jgi:hypothetical protein